MFNKHLIDGVTTVQDEINPIKDDIHHIKIKVEEHISKLNYQHDWNEDVYRRLHRLSCIHVNWSEYFKNCSSWDIIKFIFSKKYRKNIVEYLNNSGVNIII